MSKYTIFTTPKEFKGHFGIIQYNAIKSWTLLEEKPDIIIIGDEYGMKEIANELNLIHIPEVKRSEYGTPIIADIFEKGQKYSRTNVCMYVNSDVIIAKSLTDTIERISSCSNEFLAVGKRWEAKIDFLIDYNENWDSKLIEGVQKHGFLERQGTLDYFIFTKNLWASIPAFAIGRTIWDNWLLGQAIKDKKHVFDVSEDVFFIHQQHDYSHAAGGSDEVWKGPEKQKNIMFAKGIFPIGILEFCPYKIKNGLVKSNIVELGYKDYDEFIVKSLCQRGKAFYDNTNYTEALQLFEASLLFDEKVPQQFLAIGLCYTRMYEKAKAIEYYKKEIEYFRSTESAVLAESFISQL